MNTRITSKNHANLQPYGLPAVCLLQFLWAVSPKKPQGLKNLSAVRTTILDRKRFRNGSGTAELQPQPQKRRANFQPYTMVGVLTRYQTSALKVYCVLVFEPKRSKNLSTCLQHFNRKLRVLNVNGPIYPDIHTT